MSNNWIPQPPLLAKTFWRFICTRACSSASENSGHGPFLLGKENDFPEALQMFHGNPTFGSLFLFITPYASSTKLSHYSDGSTCSWLQKDEILLQTEPCRNLKGNASHGKPVWQHAVRRRHLKTSDRDPKWN